MNIKMIFTMVGNIIGDVDEGLDGSIKITNPCMIQITQEGGVLAPLYHLVEEKEMLVNKELLLFKQVCTPTIQLRNAYSREFGSGIEVANALPPRQKT